MKIQEQLTKLALIKGNTCVTISLNTHRTFPDRARDVIELKNLLKEAEKRIINEFGKRPADNLLKRLNTISDKIDMSHNLDSLHIFLSNDIEEYIRIPWKTNEDMVYIGHNFNLRSVIKAANRVEEYLVLLLSQGGVHLYKAINDAITSEVKNDDFPFGENPYYVTEREKRSDAKLMDNLVREFFNTVDKALIKVCQEKGLKCIVIGTEDNYSRLLQIADKPEIYLGYSPVNYNSTETYNIVKQSWEIIKGILYKRRKDAISEMKEAVGEGKVLTDLQDIYQAAIDGKGDLLIVHEEFSQPVIMTGERTFDLINDATIPGAIDDITNNISWEVMSKHGRVFFTVQDEIRELGEIVMKVRY